MSSITNPDQNTSQDCPLPSCNSTATSSAMSVFPGDLSASCDVSMNDLSNSVVSSSVLQVIPSQASFNSVMSVKYLSKSVFNNCVFNFQKWRYKFCQHSGWMHAYHVASVKSQGDFFAIESNEKRHALSPQANSFFLFSISWYFFVVF